MFFWSDGERRVMFGVLLCFFGSAASGFGFPPDRVILPMRVNHSATGPLSKPCFSGQCGLPQQVSLFRFTLPKNPVIPYPLFFVESTLSAALIFLPAAQGLFFDRPAPFFSFEVNIALH